MTAQIIRVTDDATRDQIAAAIGALRAKAVRLSVKDPKRWAIDDEVDELVSDWLAAEA